MQFSYKALTVFAQSEAEQKAASLFCEEWQKRFQYFPKIITESTPDFTVTFALQEESKDEAFTVSKQTNGILIAAHRLRSLVYGIGKLLRGLSVSGELAVLSSRTFGTFSPDMPIRGHGIGYTDMSNSYEAWDEVQFRRYILDLMYFGLNTVETSYAFGSVKTELMQYTFQEALQLISSICQEWDVDLTVWYALHKSRTDEETVADILDIYGNLPKISSLFLPGGDPGDLLPEAFLCRCQKIKQALSVRFPDIQLFPSAQAPHEYPDWRERFTRMMDAYPADVDGIIYAPNHAMPLDDLRRTIDARYPIHHYPDLSHNVRCETPVRFNREDWHFAWASTLSRESVNPRPLEYQLLHRRTRQYTDGQISYSEGIHDDVNKVIWSSLDFDFYAEPKEVLKEYARLFFFGADENRIADGILGLEQNWSTDPVDSACVEPTFALFQNLSVQMPSLLESWRFNLLLFRATCDRLVRMRRIFELDLLEQAEDALTDNDSATAQSILESDYPQDYKRLRASLFPMAERLFRQIGLQLDVSHFKGMSWERGCTLDTIDMPVTDRAFLLYKMHAGLSSTQLLALFRREQAPKDGCYFSFARHGFDVCGMQNGEFYIDFKGDQNTDGHLPMCMLKNYDHFEFQTKTAGLTGGDYRLRITYKDRHADSVRHHCVQINGHTVYDGAGFGGTRDRAFEKIFLTDGYQSIVYDVPASMLVNGCAELTITEPTVGFVISEFWFEKVAAS